MTHPLHLSPDYIPLEDHNDHIDHIETPVKERQKSKKHKDGPTKTYKDAIKMGRGKQFFYSIQTRIPLQYRFIRFYGKGNMIAGFICYEQYWNKLDHEAKEIIEILAVKRMKNTFAKYIGIDATILSQYNSKKKVQKKFWIRLLTMRKIVRGFETFKEKAA